MSHTCLQWDHDAGVEDISGVLDTLTCKESLYVTVQLPSYARGCCHG